VRDAIEALPVRQRQVVTLRDVDGLSAEEVCAVLSISDANQRVLLHRGRSQVRAAIDRAVP
jgi:RNA polymerase sigma-70 factor, ECF subfamily